MSTPGPGRNPSAGGTSACPGGVAATGWVRRGHPHRKAREQPSLGWAVCEPWRAPQCTDYVVPGAPP
eukprot:14951235-Alexandrium_andersonii.AAC.1